jgi:anti-sigma-K factor RskA
VNRRDDQLPYEDDLAAYLLDALPGDEAHRFERHMDGCARCQEQARWLRGSVEMLPTAIEQLEPPPALRERLMETVRAEADADSPPVQRLRRRRRGWLSSEPRPAIALTAIVIAAAAVGGYVLGSGGDNSETVTATAKSTVPGVRASVERTGDEGMLRVSGLPQRPGHIYEVWVARAGAAPEPAGLFQVNRDGTGAAAIPRGLDKADQVMVTLEPAGGSTKPTRKPLIAADI